jgi:hypothetical protein
LKPRPKAKLAGAARHLAAALLLGVATYAPLAHAGHSCEERPLTIQSFSDGMATGLMVQEALNATGRDVVLVGRQGQDLSKYGLKYSHVGLAYRPATGQPWRIYELLNQCGTAHSDLWVDGLANFFMDDPFTLDAVLIVPPEKVAARLSEALRQPAFLHGFHEAKYNMVAYPFSTRYQNSNTWVLEILAAAESSDVRIRTREQAQAWLKMAAYAPTEMHIGPFTRLGGRMFKANVAFDDHPNALRFSDRINTVTVDSIMAFVRQRDEGWTFRELKGRR